LDRRVTRALEEIRVTRVHLVHRVIPVEFLAHRAQEEIRVISVIKAVKVSKDLVDYKAEHT
jgi:hypothetical protein